MRQPPPDFLQSYPSMVLLTLFIIGLFGAGQLYVNYKEYKNRNEENKNVN